MDHDDFEDSEFPDNDEYVPYVRTTTLDSKSKGAKVSLWGKVTKVSANDGFYVKTGNDQEILIKLNKPLSEPLEGWYEIHGVYQGNCILCDEYIHFSEEMTKNIDVEGYTNLASLLMALDDPWNLGEGGMDGVKPME
ncbi:uncharacterized protein LOC123696503 [Colias croceus]|uniref:uncharacterized protein LOC123696503 n=1 Tax=Colias crocea TaxID=72248 RepID=UPI001E27CEE4|nr:uncharacterized protein LOC123696503 [Colias croceus]CAG4971249.1 unnamed protein product [Colias eurytheme]